MFGVNIYQKLDLKEIGFKKPGILFSFLFYNSVAITEVGDLNLDISIGSIGVTNCYKTFYKGTLNICQIHFIYKKKKIIMFHSCPSTLLLFTKYQPIDMKFRNFIFFSIKIFSVLFMLEVRTKEGDSKPGKRLFTKSITI